MNLQSIMNEARKMQGELQRINKQIEGTTFEGSNGVVGGGVGGGGGVGRVVIDEVVEKEILEDMILLAVNDAVKKVEKMRDDKLGKYTNGMGGLL